MTAPTAEHVDRMTAEKGWFQKQLWLIESILNGRWAYWQAICLNGTIGALPEWKIPQLDFATSLDGSQPRCGNHAELANNDAGRETLVKVGGPAEAKKHAIKTFEKALDHGRHHLQDLLNWWLWGFGSHSVTERPKLSERAAITMYHEFELYRLIGNPADWGSHISIEILGNSKKGTAWFPTPMCVADMMSQMTFGDEDSRVKSVCDCCVGTGVFMLQASNYSLNLCCQDVDPLMCSWTEFAAWLFMPWMVWGNRRLIREFRDADTPAEIEIPQPVQYGELADVREFAEAGPLFAL